MSQRHTVSDYTYLPENSNTLLTTHKELCSPNPISPPHHSQTPEVSWETAAPHKKSGGSSSVSPSISNLLPDAPQRSRASAKPPSPKLGRPTRTLRTGTIPTGPATKLT